MNILILYTSPWWNAAAYYAVTVAAGLRARGHSVVFVSDADRPAFLVARERGVAAVDLPLRSLSPLVVRRVIRLLRAMITDLRIDVINSHSAQGHLLTALGCRGVPVVRTRCDDRPVRSNPVNHWLYGRQAAAVILPSDANRRRLEHTIPRTVGKAQVIRCGLDINAFASADVPPVLRQQLKLDSDTIVIGNLGRLSPEKGPRHFLAVAGRVAQACKNAYFVMSGLSVQYTPDDVLAWGRECGLAGRLSVLGPFDDARQILRDFDIGVIASQYSESNCRVALEYMALRIPVVSTDVNVLGELFVAGDSGFLHGPNDVEGMAQAVIRLVDNPTLRCRVGQAGYDRALAEYDLPHFIDQTERTLREAIGG